MAQQLHRSPYGMVVIARIGSMKFLPIMNGHVRRAATHAAFAAACANVQAQRALRADGRKVAEKNDARFLLWPSRDGMAMNRFVHRIVMSVLLVAALVLIWNVLGSR
ncbi:hypothetical protein ACVIIV_005452 [Bradyrhizobium sp. USDA 4354]